ncbi:MAG: YHS domain-containing (seleno)protein [Wenzhouxiangellaceae bacterium]
MNRLSQVLIAVALLSLTLSVQAGDWNSNDANVVLDGYDVVAYHTQAEAVRGDASHALEYDGAVFHFSSAENRDLFKADPDKYAPKYKGYCAFAVSAKNAKVPADPKTFKLYNGELLVFFNDLWDGQKFNTKVPWNADEQAMYRQAEQHWPALNKS